MNHQPHRQPRSQKVFPHSGCWYALPAQSPPAAQQPHVLFVDTSMPCHPEPCSATCENDAACRQAGSRQLLAHQPGCGHAGNFMHSFVVLHTRSRALIGTQQPPRNAVRALGRAPCCCAAAVPSARGVAFVYGSAGACFRCLACSGCGCQCLPVRPYSQRCVSRRPDGAEGRYHYTALAGTRMYQRTAPVLCAAPAPRLAVELRPAAASKGQPVFLLRQKNQAALSPAAWRTSRSTSTPVPMFGGQEGAVSCAIKAGTTSSMQLCPCLAARWRTTAARSIATCTRCSACTRPSCERTPAP